jgi:protein-S-isoprenylcysteine O-methyltransferase Ste14
MLKLTIFILATVGITLFSLKSFRVRYSHGFFRFFVFEGVLILILMNIEIWFSDPFSIHQIISWVLLMIGLYYVIVSFTLLKRVGKPSESVNEPQNVRFENTTTLVTVGVYKYIRHPMYGSLLFLVWGVCFKGPDLLGAAIALAVSGFLYATARVEEGENIRRFGDQYATYMTRSKRFIPFVF